MCPKATKIDHKSNTQIVPQIFKKNKLAHKKII